MTEVNYQLHFSLLFLAAGVLTIWGEPDYRAIPAAILPHFALVGFLHAITWVLALRTRTEPTKIVAFTATAAALSVATIYVSLGPAAVISQIGGGSDWKVMLWIIAASAGGATAYWIAIRRFWLPKLRLTSLALTVASCAAATLLALAALLRDASPHTPVAMPDVDVLTYFWWTAFSLSILVADRGWLRRVARSGHA